MCIRDSIKRIGFAALGVSAALGFQFYDKTSTANKTKKEMLSICSTDSSCQNAVNTYFKECFGSSYRMGSRRRRSSLNTSKLSSCINKNSGVAYFGN